MLSAERRGLFCEVFLHFLEDCFFSEKGADHAEDCGCACCKEEGTGGDVVGIIDSRDASLFGKAVK